MRYSRNHCKNNLSWRDITGINKILRKSPLVPHVVCQQQCLNDRQLVNAELRTYWPLPASLVPRTRASSKICLLKTYYVRFILAVLTMDKQMYFEYFLFQWKVSVQPNRRARYGESTWAQLCLPVYGSHRGTNLWSVHKTNIRCVKAVYRWYCWSFL